MADHKNRLLLLAVLAFFSGLYWYGAVRQALHVNTDLRAVDQLAYIDYAQELRRSDFTEVPEFNRVPLYPLFQSVFFQEDLTEDRYFEFGKINNIVLSLGLLIGFAVILSQELGSWGAAGLTMLTAFEVFIFKAGWFQAELLFYFLNFTLFLLMWRCLQRPTWPRAIGVGLVGALAHLTKASVLPGLILFLGFLVGRALRDLAARAAETPPHRPLPLHQLLMACGVVVLFFGLSGSLSAKD